MRKLSNKSSHGFTILELVIAIAVAAILISVAVPSMQDIFKRNEVAGQNNDLIALLHLARNEAIRRNLPSLEFVEVQLDIDQAGFSWNAYVRPPSVDVSEPGCPVGVVRCSFHTNTFMETSSVSIRFDNRGYSVTTEGEPENITIFLAHRDCDSERHARIIRVLPAGQVSSDAESCDAGE